VVSWKDQPAVVVGAGPSAARTPLELARGKARVVAVNESWRLAPWADVLFAMDGIWWVDNKGVPQFPGRRVTSSPHAMKTFGLDCFICIGSTSGLRSIYLAEKFGASLILLVGFDMHDNGGTHWHPPHNTRVGLRNPGENEMRQWREDVERVADKFAERGTKVINCTPGSALTCFPYVPFERALDGDDHPHSAVR